MTSIFMFAIVTSYYRISYFWWYYNSNVILFPFIYFVSRLLFTIGAVVKFILFATYSHIFQYCKISKYTFSAIYNLLFLEISERINIYKQKCALSSGCCSCLLLWWPILYSLMFSYENIKVLTVQQRKFSSTAKLCEQSKRFYGTVSICLPIYLYTC